MCEWIAQVHKRTGIDLINAKSSATNAVSGNILVEFFAEGSESDASKATVAWESGAHPAVEAPIPEAIPDQEPSSSNVIVLECVRWEKAGTSANKHVVYVLKVTNPGHVPHELCKRWREISDLSKNLYRYGRSLPRTFRWQDNGEQPLPTKWGSAGFDPATLATRTSEINSFLEHLSDWMNRLLQHSSTNLLDSDTQPDLIRQFFAAGAAYDPSMDTVRTIVPIARGGSATPS